MQHAARFQKLDELLVNHRNWWQLQAFHHRSLPWQKSSLVDELMALSDAQVEHFTEDSHQLVGWLSRWIPQLPEVVALQQLPNCPKRQLQLPPRLDIQIPGRKWNQILAFVASRPISQAPVLEWCAGKGHLGRCLGVLDQCSVSSLEWLSELCEQGEALARRHALTQNFVCADAFSPEARQYIEAGMEVVALHACGDLHTQLMRHCCERSVEALTFSPCCYHLIQGNTYLPMSKQAQAAQLSLTRQDLSLPLQQRVTAGASVRRRRDKELQRRLAFDEWQRSHRGRDSYLPLPTLKAEHLKMSFSEFVTTMAAKKQIQPVGAVDEERWLAAGYERFRLVRRMELVMHAFRRPLELWLVLDRALYLQEHGAEVSVGEFCETTLTPRNILLDARWNR